MAKQRYINTRFWNDNYIAELDPSEKLVFLYFLTNSFTNISGVYEIPVKQIALDTGFNVEMIYKITARFERDGKIIYKDGWVVILNFLKHQSTKSIKVRIGIEENLKNAPKWTIDTLSIPYEYGIIYSNLNSNLNPNPNLNSTMEIEEKEVKPDEEKKSIKKTDLPKEVKDVYECIESKFKEFFTYEEFA